MLIQHLPLELQEKMLLENQYGLAPFNSFGFSMISAIIQFGAQEQIETLVPFVIAQGFPVIANEKSIDPLWQLLTRLNMFQGESTFPKATIASLLEQTELNETHINALHLIKKRNKELYQEITDEFPALVFDEPDTLIRISCK